LLGTWLEIGAQLRAYERVPMSTFVRIVGSLFVAVSLFVTLRPAASAAGTLDLIRPEQEVLTILNQARSDSAAPAPQLDEVLTTIARNRSTDMAARHYFSHYTPEQTTFFDLLKDSGMTWNYAGETITRNNYEDRDASTVAAQTLLTSPRHRAVILDPQYNAVGIGHAVDSQGMHYYTIIFVRR